MGKSNSTQYLVDLAQWFERQKRVLPWRDEPSLYRVWVSEIMLQQTQVVTVVPYFERFLARFPTVEVLAAAPSEDVMLNWAGLGYYSRARNLHRAAQQIVASGGFPKTREDWEAVPGVGPYTAGAILSIALDLPEAILDGNVERVLSRLRRVARDEGDAAYKTKLWSLSRDAVERGHARDLKPSVINQALMELGATVCTPKKPKCPVCPWSKVCEARAAGDMESFPPKKKPKQWLTIEEELHCVVNPEGRILLRKRSDGEWRAGLWDLLEKKPAGDFKRIGSVRTKHVVTRHKISRETVIWVANRVSAKWRAAESDTDHQWISVQTPDVAVGSALKRTIKQVQEEYPELKL